MPHSRRQADDEIEAVLGDAPPTADLATTAAIVHDLRSAYLRDEALVRSEALAVAMEAPPTGSRAAAATEIAGSPPRGRRRLLTTLSALTAGITGKVVLGTAVAAASVGGLGAAGVIDIPNLGQAAHGDPPGLVVTDTPGDDRNTGTDEAETAIDEPATEINGDRGPDATPSPRADDGQATADRAQEKADAAAAFSAAMTEWASCVSDAAAAHDGTSGPFDPADECGERPHPSDFGITDPPSHRHAADAEPPGRSADAGKPEQVPGAGKSERGPGSSSADHTPGPPADDSPGPPAHDSPAPPADRGGQR